MLQVLPQVQTAIRTGRPVIALESTIISHGLPFPQNLHVARALEATILAANCIPATIALMGGKVKIGLTDHELEALAQAKGVIKTSRRDFAHVLARGLIGATTVSATMMAASMAGIRVFVTGGLGGVHHGDSLDVSADLAELSRTPVHVVCAGVKSILDIGRTLEVLETNGVPVATYAQENFPAFYFRNSGFPSPLVYSSHKEFAQLVHTSTKLGLSAGSVFAVPIPETDELAHRFQNDIKEAIEEARVQGIRGKFVTPFLLSRLNELSRGDTIKANVALVLNNARFGCKVALELERLESRPVSIPATSRPLIIGATVRDVTAKSEKSRGEDCLHTSTTGRVTESLGGVGRNMAEACFRTGGNPLFLTYLGKAEQLELESIGLDTSLFQLSDRRKSSTYCAVHDADGELITAVADMDANSEFDATTVKKCMRESLKEKSVVAFDGNLPSDVVLAILESCKPSNIVLFEPTSKTKSISLTNAPHDFLERVSIVTPNQFEIQVMASQVESLVPSDQLIPSVSGELPPAFGMYQSYAEILLVFHKVVILKLGEQGVAIFTKECNGKAKCIHLEPEKTVVGGNSSGAGDTLAGALVSGISVRGLCQSDLTVDNSEFVSCVRLSMKAAALSVQSTEHTISRSLKPTDFQ